MLNSGTELNKLLRSNDFRTPGWSNLEYPRDAPAGLPGFTSGDSKRQHIEIINI
jgi:hypothetical protein